MLNRIHGLLISRLVAIVFVVLTVFVGCTRPDESAGKGVVAKVGSFEISDDHFTNQLKRFYLRTGQAANINEDFRLGVINSRIERYSIVEYARDKGWASDHDAEWNKVVIQRKILMDAYKRAYIDANVEVSDASVREIFRRYHSSARASHLYAPNRAAADSLMALLDKGIPFEELARHNFRDPVLAANAGDLGYFTLDEMDVAFEETAFGMRVGEISGPVKTSRGYSIIKLTDLVTRPIITEYEFAQHRPQLEMIARQQQEELALRADMRRFAESCEWNDALVGQLWQMIRDNPSQYATGSTEIAELPLPVHDDLRSQSIARCGRTDFTVGDFMIEAFYTPQERRAGVRDRHAFREQLEGYAYRFQALSRLNTNRLLRDPFISGSIDETFYSYLFERFEAYLDGLVNVEEREIRNTFASDPENFYQPLMLNMAEIVVTDADLAGELRHRLDMGENFKKLLDLYGIDVATKAYHGEIGLMPIHDYGVMASSLNHIRPGEFAGPFQIANNYHIVLKCIERNEPRARTLDEARPDVERYLFYQKRQQIRNELVAGLRTRYNVTIDMDRLNSLSFEL